MNTNQTEKTIAKLVKKNEKTILTDWLREQLPAKSMRPDLIDEKELEEQSSFFLNSFQSALQSEEFSNLQAACWAETRELLGSMADVRASQGFTPSETAMFIFSLKQPIFSMLQEEFGDNTRKLTDTLWSMTEVLDKLGLYTTDVNRENREKVIKQQSDEIMELSTPVVQLWPGILAVPVIGTLDSARTEVVMEKLLQRISDTESDIAIIDITGVPEVDTMVAQHLMKTVEATHLMGAECIISGIRPSIANTIVSLDISFNVTTKSKMSAALSLALEKTGWSFTRKES